jgi:hypothetical protein
MIGDLIRKMPLEEWRCRHRCVEALGHGDSVDRIAAGDTRRTREAASSATYVRMETFFDKKMAPGRRTRPAANLCGPVVSP